ncbi:hypothetical protein RRG08_024484 [Elysia crispata]|uniref:Uncharacterized protein n=1 Tax=Elysia crispata TaxID=231223 RepID=A0AAE1D2B8_9GAST|nr:hypothetical protein RRG08_024484 [Elysia crispata]
MNIVDASLGTLELMDKPRGPHAISGAMRTHAQNQHRWRNQADKARGRRTLERAGNLICFAHVKKIIRYQILRRYGAIYPNFPFSAAVSAPRPHPCYKTTMLLLLLMMMMYLREEAEENGPVIVHTPGNGSSRPEHRDGVLNPREALIRFFIYKKTRDVSRELERSGGVPGGIKRMDIRNLMVARTMKLSVSVQGRLGEERSKFGRKDRLRHREDAERAHYCLSLESPNTDPPPYLALSTCRELAVKALCCGGVWLILARHRGEVDDHRSARLNIQGAGGALLGVCHPVEGDDKAKWKAGRSLQGHACLACLACAGVPGQADYWTCHAPVSVRSLSIHALALFSWRYVLLLPVVLGLLIQGHLLEFATKSGNGWQQLATGQQDMQLVRLGVPGE